MAFDCWNVIWTDHLILSPLIFFRYSWLPKVLLFVWLFFHWSLLPSWLFMNVRMFIMLPRCMRFYYIFLCMTGYCCMKFLVVGKLSFWFILIQLFWMETQIKTLSFVSQFYVLESKWCFATIKFLLIFFHNHQNLYMLKNKARGRSFSVAHLTHFLTYMQSENIASKFHLVNLPNIFSHRGIFDFQHH